MLQVIQANRGDNRKTFPSSKCKFFDFFSVLPSCGGLFGHPHTWPPVPEGPHWAPTLGAVCLNSWCVSVFVISMGGSEGWLVPCLGVPFMVLCHILWSGLIGPWIKDPPGTTFSSGQFPTQLQLPTILTWLILSCHLCCPQIWRVSWKHPPGNSKSEDC